MSDSFVGLITTEPGPDYAINMTTKSGYWEGHEDMIHLRYGHSGAFLDWESWWVSGGYGGGRTHDSTEVYRSATGTFENYTKLPEPMYHHNLVRVNSTTFALFGGGSTLTEKAWIFNSETEIWQSVNDLPTARVACQAGVAKYGDDSYHVIVTGGYGVKTTEIFSLDTLTWRVGPDFPYDVSYASVVPFEDTFLVVGGYTEDFAFFGEMDTVIKFDPLTESWIELPVKMKDTRESFAAFTIPDWYANCSDFSQL